MTHLKGISSVKIMEISLCWWKFIIISDQTEIWSHLYDKKLMDVVPLVGFLVFKWVITIAAPNKNMTL
jgi:hypothetical protein